MIVIGIDVGAISIKIAALGEESDRDYLSRLCAESPNYISVEDTHVQQPLAMSPYRRIKGEPAQNTYELLEELFSYIPHPAGARVTGIGSVWSGRCSDAALENDFRAMALGVGTLHPEVRTVFEMGGVNSKFISLSNEGGTVGITDYEKNGDCAAGTGSFIDQQASRLQYSIEEIGDIVMQAGKQATVAGRCSVFAKSDMIHAQQKGYQPPEILKGLCEAVVRNFKALDHEGQEDHAAGRFYRRGGGQQGRRPGDALGLQAGRERLFVPRYYAWMGAIGAALLEYRAPVKHEPKRLAEVRDVVQVTVGNFPRTDPLSMDEGAHAA